MSAKSFSKLQAFNKTDFVFRRQEYANSGKKQCLPKCTTP